MRGPILGVLGLAMLVVGCGSSDPGSDVGSVSSALHGRHPHEFLPNDFPFRDPTGFLTTVSTTGNVDLSNEFFQVFGTNGRSCGTCHAPSDAWSITPPHIQDRFEDSHGTDPVFRPIDGANRPDADVSTEAARRIAYSQLLSKGLIRIGDTLGLNPPTTADFTITNVDDPYGYATPTRLSLFRRPLPTTNLPALTTVMWDGRETFLGTDHCNHADEGGKCFQTVNPFDLSDQANGATLGHAQAAQPLTAAQQASIVAFEMTLFTAQFWDDQAHYLAAHHANGGADFLSGVPTYYGLNDNLGDYVSGAPFTSVIFTEFTAWTDKDDPDVGPGVEDARAAVARGEDLFNNFPITISGVSGLNFNSPFIPPLPASFTGSCGTCHDTTHFGNHSIVAPLNIGLTDASRRTPDMPLYTIQHNVSPFEVVQTTDPGRALISGKFADVGKFKGPILRGLAARAPYFHNGFAADFGAVIDFYNTRFAMGLTSQQHDDLVAFLGTL